ncbi:MAG: glutathione S-transferase family protein [Rhodospirillales bacterium]
MASLNLVIGNRNYSSWSLRPWLALKVAGADFAETMIPLQTPTTKTQILRYSSAGKVPVLIANDTQDGGRAIWDSLAICEYVAERWPDANLWPADMETRAHARSISAEMHAGFQALREHMPMNIRASHPGKGMDAHANPGVAADVERIDAIWHDCRTRHAAAGDFLFGGFTVADCMYAPVVFRFATYAPHLSDPAQAYVEAMLAHPAMQAWRAAAEAEPETIPSHDGRYA